MTHSTTDPSRLIATRLCHDLASPIGAISNTADLMKEMAADSSAEDVDMVARTAERTSQMLKFYRLVFGTGSGGPMDIARFTDLMRCQEVPGRIGLTVTSQTNGTIETDQARIGGLLLMVARALIGLRGEMRLIVPEGGMMPSVAARGDKIDSNAGLLDLVSNPAASTFEPKHVEFVLLRDAVADAGAVLSIQRQAAQITLTPEAAARA
ncbi:MAG: hypothetical protein AAFR17_09490 [Pseudomonadota bacterium]